MKFWCYFLGSWNEELLSKIVEQQMVTFPEKHKMIIDDTIFFYNKHHPYGFMGYVRVSDALTLNLNKYGKYVVELFNDKTFNKYYVEIKFAKFLHKPIGKKLIFNDNTSFMSEFKKHLKIKDHIINISDDVGKSIRSYIRDYQEELECTDDEENNPDDKENTETSDSENENNEEKPDIKSRFIIPIMIIPCKKFKQDIESITDNERPQWIFDHVNNCKKCDLTNNNDRVTMDMIPCDMAFYRMTDEEEIETLLDAYQSLSYYETRRFRMIEINNEENDYHQCFCIIGRLKEEH